MPRKSKAEATKAVNDGLDDLFKTFKKIISHQEDRFDKVRKWQRRSSGTNSVIFMGLLIFNLLNIFVFHIEWISAQVLSTLVWGMLISRFVEIGYGFFEIKEMYDDFEKYWAEIKNRE